MRRVHKKINSFATHTPRGEDDFSLLDSAIKYGHGLGSFEIRAIHMNFKECIGC